MDDDFVAIRQIQEGREAGLVSLLERYREPVFRLAYRYLYSETDAAEITQEVFVRVWEKASFYQPKGKVASWLFSITANVCRDHLRRQKSRGRYLSSLPEGDAKQPDETALTASAQAVSDESVLEIERAIQNLPEKLRFPFVFCVLEEHSYDECAEIIGGTRKSVETRIYRARKRLQETLAHFREKL